MCTGRNREKLPREINVLLPLRLQEKISVAHLLSPIGYRQANKEMEAAILDSDRKEKRKDVPIQPKFNAAQEQLRTMLIKEAFDTNRMDEVINLTRASSIPALQPHLQDIFNSLKGDPTSSASSSPDRQPKTKKTRTNDNLVEEPTTTDNDDDVDDDDTWAGTNSVYSNNDDDLDDDDLDEEEAEYEDPEQFIILSDADIKS